MSIYTDRIQWERKYYKDLTTLHRSNIVKCELCEETESVIIPDFIDHLRCVHKVREIFHHPDHDILLREFTINEEDFTAECKTCNNSIDYKMYGVYLLKNHLEIYHGNSSYIYETIVNIESGRDTLDKYIIVGNEATCPKCDLKINMADSNLLAEIKLEELLEHYFYHSLVSQHIRDEFKDRIDKELKKKQERNPKLLDLKEQEEKKKIKNEKKFLRYLELQRQEKYLTKNDKLLQRWAYNSIEISRSGRTILNEPVPSTSTADDRIDQAEYISTKKRKSSMNKTWLKRKKRNKTQFQL